MEQVPKIHAIPNYLIIGNGKMASHLTTYFEYKKLAYSSWSRSSSLNLSDLINESDVILVLISDDQIENFYQSNLREKNKKCIHFSGSLVLDEVQGCHPLSMFGENQLDIETYEKISFICEEGFDFKTIFPTLTNPCYFICKKDKAYYHALCVMAGNFTTLLWDKAFSSFEKQLNLPVETLFPYMEQVISNLKNEKISFTGPISRNDKKTINANMTSLEGDPFQGIYKSFIELNRSIKS